MEEPEDDFLNFFLLNMSAPIIMAFLAPLHFMFYEKFLQRTLDFILKKKFSS